VRITFHHQQYGRAVCIPFHHQQYGCALVEGLPLSTNSSEDVSQSIACSVDVQGLCIPIHLCKVVLIAGMLDSSASAQSGTGINKNADAGTSQVPERDTGCQNADADVQLWPLLSKRLSFTKRIPALVMVETMEKSSRQ
jgi:hypothetical protein